jgi:hypothetical protein
MFEYPADESGEKRLLRDYEVVLDEHAAINQRRHRRFGFSRDVSSTHPTENDANYLKQGKFNTIGLALSGGGIRSASFCLGAMQALAKHKLFQYFDYLSTVSGGGYIGICTSLTMNKDGKSFPFISLNEFKDTEAVKDLRDRANYLRAGEINATLSNIAIYVRGLVANLAIVVSILLALAAFTLWCNPNWSELRSPDFFGWPLPDWFWRWSTFGITPNAALACLFVFWLWTINIDSSARAGLKGYYLKFARYLLPLLALIAFFEWQPLLVDQMTSIVGSSGPQQPGVSWLSRIIGVLTPILTASVVFSKTIGDMFKSVAGQSGWIDRLKQAFGTTIVWIVAGLLLPLLLWLCYLLLVFWGLEWNDCKDCLAVTFQNKTLHPMVVYGLVAAVLYLVSIVLQPNNNSPHRLYRDRLSNAFCPRFVDPVTRKERPVRLSEMDGNGPYNLINTTLNVQADKRINRRGRNGEFFLFSPHHVGCEATGFAKTVDVENGLAPDLDAATAMAISGAAVSANMGSESIKPLRFTLAIFNVRLGYWMSNVKQLVGKSRYSVLPYFLRDVLGQLTSTKKLLYLTDGGHIENLGVYELLRRRCKVIFAVDAEADPEMNFGALVKLQRYARIDLGARIEINWSEIRKRSLAAQKNEGAATSGPHCAIGQIQYENGDPGVLVYIKSSISGDENDYIRDYNRRVTAYPHETTADQFFSEEQFEVYRALGFHAVHGLLKGEHYAQMMLPNSTGVEAPILERIFDPDAKGFGLSDIHQLLGTTGRPTPDITPQSVQPAVKLRSKSNARRSKPRIPRR